MRRFAHRAAPWLLPLAMMALIFALSSMPADKEHHGLLYAVSRKLAHFGGYAVLLACWWRALTTKLAHRRALGLAFVVTVVYAMTDEFHQTFVSGRNGTPVDVGIDAAGGLAAALLISRARARRSRGRREVSDRDRRRVSA